MFEFLKDKAKIVDAGIKGDISWKPKKHKWLIIMVVLGIGILAFGGSGGAKEKNSAVQKEQTTDDWSDDYIEAAERRLTEVLTDIKGAGNVRVMMHFDYRREKFLAKNKTGSIETQVTDQGSESHSEEEESVLLFGSGGEEQPYVIKEGYPEPSGVLIVATGATDERVRLEMYEAVKALYGISGHRIKISAASN